MLNPGSYREICVFFGAWPSREFSVFAVSFYRILLGHAYVSLLLSQRRDELF